MSPPGLRQHPSSATSAGPPVGARWSLAVLAVLGVGCALPPPPLPAGAAPLRYRDQIANVQLTSGTRYGSAPGPDGRAVALLTDIYRPANDPVQRRPAIIWAHPGGFTSGSRTSSDVRDFARRFAGRGYVALSIDYRLTGDGSCSAEAFAACRTPIAVAKHDLQAAVRWVRSHAAELRVDPGRIAVAGSSAGAITAVYAGATPEEPGSSGTPGVASTAQAVVSFSGGTPETAIFGRGDPPMLFAHGTLDETVPFAWARQDADRLAAVGSASVLDAVTGAGHVPYDGDAVMFDRFDRSAVAFLYARLRLAALG